MSLEAEAKIFVAGHRGLVGSALVRRLEGAKHSNLLKRTHQELDLTDGRSVDEFFRDERPDVVFLAAAKVGGINANATYLFFPIYLSRRMLSTRPIATV
jgi:GDP-L-fucose synthase